MYQYIFLKAIGNALCATGFGESIAGVIAGEKDGSPWVERLVAAAVIIFLTLINLAGVKVGLFICCLSVQVFYLR